MTFRARLVALLAAVLLLATACGGAASDTTGAIVGDAAPSTGDDNADAGPGPDLGLLGQGSLEGQDVVVWFWAEW